MYVCGLVICLSACKGPAACLQPSTKKADLGEAIHFKNCSQGGINPVWDFGDSTQTSEADPTHRFEAPGPFEVSLTIMNKQAKKSSKATEVIRIRPPVAEQITGNWTYYKKATGEGMEYAVEPSETWGFDTSGELQTPQHNYQWQLDPNGKIDLEHYNIYATFKIVKLYEGEMIIREELEYYHSTQITDHYFKR